MRFRHARRGQVAGGEAAVAAGAAVGDASKDVAALRALAAEELGRREAAEETLRAGMEQSRTEVSDFESTAASSNDASTNDGSSQAVRVIIRSLGWKRRPTI